LRRNPAETKIVVQSRVGSRRLPRKALADINGFRLIEWVLIRTKSNPKEIPVVLATTEKPEDDELVELAAKHGIESVRGSEDDLVDRFLEVSKIHKLENIIRVCADNPFVSGRFIGDLHNYWLRNKLDYAYNHAPVGGLEVMDGFGAEMLSVRLLKRIDSSTPLPDLREHVTAAVWRDLVVCRKGTPTIPEEFKNSGVSLDVDSADDLIRVQRIAEQATLMPHSSDQQIAKAFQSL